MAVLVALMSLACGGGEHVNLKYTTWRSDSDYEMVFNGDGTCTFTNWSAVPYTCTWTQDGNNVTITEKSNVDVVRTVEIVDPFTMGGTSVSSGKPGEVFNWKASRIQ